MQKVHIEEPASYPFCTDLPIRITDLNYGNHVGNDAFMGLIHESRVRYLRQLGYSELQVEGYGLIMHNAAIRFMSEFFYGDVVTVAVGPLAIAGVGFDLVYRLTVLRNQKSVVAGLAKTGMVLFDYDKRRPVALPEILKKKLQMP